MLLAAVLLAASILPAAAACTGLAFNPMPTAVNWRGSLGTGYSVFDNADRLQAVPLTIVSTGGTCTYFITATLLGPDNYVDRKLYGGIDALRFNLYVDSTRGIILRDIPVAGPSDVLVGTFASSGRGVDYRTYYFDIPPLQVVRPGSYENTVVIKLFQGNLVQNQLVQTVLVRHRATVFAATEVSLVPVGQPFNKANREGTVDLGNVNDSPEALIEAALNMRIRTNTGYSVTLQSQNGGALRLGGTIRQGALAYTLLINGESASLAGGAVAALPPAHTVTTADGINLPISIALLPRNTQQPAPAGVYSDVITILVKPY
jgi:spore coat protein U-like protein